MTQKAPPATGVLALLVVCKLLLHISAMTSVRVLSRRAVRPGQYVAPRLGLRRYSAVLDRRARARPLAPRRFAARGANRPGARRRDAHDRHGVDDSRTRRQRLRARPGRPVGDDVSGLPRSRALLFDERLRPGVLGRRDPGAASRVGPLGKEALARPRLHARPGLLERDQHSLAVRRIVRGPRVDVRIAASWSSPESGLPLLSALSSPDHIFSWQIAHGWPTLEFMRNAAQRQDERRLAPSVSPRPTTEHESCCRASVARRFVLRTRRRSTQPRPGARVDVCGRVCAARLGGTQPRVVPGTSVSGPVRPRRRRVGSVSRSQAESGFDPPLQVWSWPSAS